MKYLLLDFCAFVALMYMFLMVLAQTQDFFAGFGSFAMGVGLYILGSLKREPPEPVKPLRRRRRARKL